MTTTDFSVTGQKVLVVGAARSGVAAAQLLVRRGAAVTLTDRKPEIPHAAELRAAGVALELGGHVAATFASSNLIVLSPGVPADLPEVARARAAGVHVIGELELASRWLRGPIVAITGTKGKSTTTTLVGRMLEASGRRVLVGGNIGLPVSAQVDASTRDTVHVIETSSFQLETTDTFRPWIAALLNFSPDHLDRHPDEASYAAAKLRIFANQRPEDWAVVNADSAEVREMAVNLRAQVVRYGVDNVTADVHVGNGFVWQRTSEGDVPLLPLAAVQLQGRHMLSNVVAATAISHLAGATGSALAKALNGFHGLEHVMELVATKDGVRFVNDSKATNIDAAAKSIESFDRVVAIIGGKYKGGDFADLIGPLRAHGRGVVAIGEARGMVRDALQGVLPVVEASTLRDAVRKAFDLAVPGGVVLLAPACSSFDMFADYADRGRQFKQEVLTLIESA
ncbi:MAG TPA: UDP-N-acetylmuramoyl-L-alanine--D-glutamate ligase [Vicinamibacterales bacterium]|nr:UDP-N-acetylmuramoyl-L-alanine--D-glutamate ligase [Vicinamibacterales bacterium]